MATEAPPAVATGPLPAPSFPRDAVAAARVPIISHRTHVGTHPENSWSGLAAAVASGADGVEMDVRATRDGHLVLMHDRSLRRRLGDPRSVDAVTLAELLVITPKGEPAGSTVPLLDDALALCAGNLRPVIDVKQRGVAPLLRAALDALAGSIEPWVWSHDPAIIDECMRVLDDAVPLSLIVRPWLVDSWRTPEAMHAARAAGLAGLVFEQPYVDAALIAQAAEGGLALHCGRTNRPADIRRILRLRPASMCSDFPERALPLVRIDLAGVPDSTCAGPKVPASGDQTALLRSA